LYQGTLSFPLKAEYERVNNTLEGRKEMAARMDPFDVDPTADSDAPPRPLLQHEPSPPSIETPVGDVQELQSSSGKPPLAVRTSGIYPELETIAEPEPPARQVASGSPSGSMDIGEGGARFLIVSFLRTPLSLRPRLRLIISASDGGRLFSKLPTPGDITTCFYDTAGGLIERREVLGAKKYPSLSRPLLPDWHKVARVTTWDRHGTVVCDLSSKHGPNAE
jgi:hypothetical protein